MNTSNHDLEAITVRRANVVDGDVVRYRVYSSPIKFVVVVADSALMAIKASGIAKPHKIMRDLLTDGVAVEAQKIAPSQSQERVVIRTAEIEQSDLVAELPDTTVSAEEVFVPLGITELRNQSASRVRILSPDMVSEIIEQHTKRQVDQPAEIAPVQAPASIQPEPVIAEPPPAPPPAPPEPSIEEKMTQLAQEVLPSIEDLDPEFHPKAPERKELSKEEVEKLLNG